MAGNTGFPNYLPYPFANETPDVPRDIKNLADAINAKLPAAKFLSSSSSISFDAKGEGTLTHNAGWTPSIVVAVPWIGTSNPVTVNPMVGTSGASSVKLKAYRDGQPFNGTLTVSWFIRD